jgi:MerR family transcriptional regulator, light-induced transcriptional regulator
MCPEPVPALRIGELSRRAGVSAALLRAWESRYGLLRPIRSQGRYRLYSEADLGRIRRMQALLASGLSAAQAAQAVLSQETASPATDGGGTGGIAAAAAALDRALRDFDEPGAQAVLDRLLASFTVESVLGQVITPYLHHLGEQWARGEVSVACEHFASNILRGRLAGLARGWGTGHGPLALLACPPGEQHDLGLLAFGIVLHRNGWRIGYLGADTPMSDLHGTATELRPALTVLAAVTSERYAEQEAGLTSLAAALPLALAGAGATESLTYTIGARRLAGDPVTEAQQIQGGAGKPTAGSDQLG